MSEPEPFAYDRLHYPAKPYHLTRPDHLEIIGHLFGMTPRPADEARVLEIGCGVGDNLLLAAECFPRARFVGIDLSASQIDAGRRLQERIGADNVELRALDLDRLDAGFGEFDYIVAHGLYSWVPEPVRETLLEVIAGRLAPQGIGFVSHNVKPGWYAKALARGIMRYHTRGLVEPSQRVPAARRFLELVLARANPAERLYRATIADRVTTNDALRDDYLYHDDLSEHCDGCWFWELAERLRAHRLQFLADANTETLGPTGLTPETLAEVERMSNGVVEREQHLDFLRNRAFRLTLVCHAAVVPRRQLEAAQLLGLHVGLDPGVEHIAMGGTSPAAALTVSTKSSRIEVDDPLTKQALITLGQVWPGSLPFAEVAARTLPLDAPVAELAGRLLDLFRAGFVALSRRPPTFATTAPARPRACALARAQAATSSSLVNLRHTYSRLDDEERRVAPLLDGSRDRQALAGELGLDAAAVDAVLARLARLALLLVE